MVLRQVVFEIIILIQWFLDQIEHITGVHIITMLQKFLITVQYFWSLSLFCRMKFGLNNFFITVKYSACFYVKFSPLLKESVVPLINNLKTTLKSVPITNEQPISFCIIMSFLSHASAWRLWIFKESVILNYWLII